MLIVYKNVVINLDTVHSFWKTDTIEGCDEELYYIMFTDTASIVPDKELNFFPFKTAGERDKAFQEILFAFAEDKKVFAIVTTPQEDKKP